MSKKLISLFLVLLLALAVVGCGNSSTPPAEEPKTEAEAPADDPKTDAEEPGEEAGEEAGDYKIGIVTGTVSQGEEEFEAARNMVAKYGDMVKHVTYPDDFTKETETTIAQIKGLAADPDMKAIVICQAVPGTVAAIDAVKETREDIIFIAGAPHEDVDTVAERADIYLDVNQYERGNSIMQQAYDMGAKTFVHYSFPRHMQMQLLAARRDIMKAKAEELGIDFVEVDAPDPTSDAGVTGAQQFIIEDVPRQVEKYGVDTAFFSTNCSMQEPLIKGAVETKAIYPEQCCPSPYHAYPGALGIEIPEDKAGDDEYLSAEIAKAIEEKGVSGRFATWVGSANANMIYTGVNYAIEYVEGKIDRVDPAAAERILKETVGVEQEKIKVEPYTNANGDVLENVLFFVLGSQVF